MQEQSPHGQCFEESLEERLGEWHDLDVVDCHGHLGAFRGYDLSIPTLLANIRRFGVRRVLVSNIDGAALEQTANVDETEANRRALETLRAHHDVLGGLLWARPENGSVERLEPFTRERLPSGERAFVGVKFHPEMNHFPADDPRVEPYLVFCARHRLPAVFHCDQPGSSGAPERIHAAARRQPTVPVVLYHMVFEGGPHGPAIDACRSALDTGDADLYLETAQADPAGVVDAVRAVGADRVLFGTDATYYGAEHYERYEPMVELLRRELPAGELRAVMGGNARRLFEL